MERVARILVTRGPSEIGPHKAPLMTQWQVIAGLLMVKVLLWKFMKI